MIGKAGQAAPDPAGEAYGAPLDLLAVLRGHTSKREERKGRGEGREGEGCLGLKMRLGEFQSILDININTYLTV